MTDIIPPTTPPQLTLSTQPSAPAAPVARAEPVRSAPENTRHNERHTRLEGRVKSYTPAHDGKRGEARISTPQGEVVVQTDTPLPPDAEVVVELYTQKNQQLANIYLLQTQGTQAKEALKALAAQTQTATLQEKPPTLPPAPPLAVGQKLPALLINPTPAQTPSAPAQDITTYTTQALQSLAKAGIKQVPAQAIPFLPVAPDVIQTLLSAPDIPAAFNALPEKQQNLIAEFLTQPKTQAFIATSTGVTLPTLPNTPQAATQISPEAEPENDFNLIQFLKTQIMGKITPQAFAKTPEAQAPLQTLAPPAQDTPNAPSGKTAMPQGMLSVLELLQSTPLGGQPDLQETAGQLFSTRHAFGPLQESEDLLNAKFFKLSIRDIQAPAQQDPAQQAPAEQAQNANTPDPKALRGVVSALTSDGHPVIETPDKQQFVLHMPAQVAQGSIITFEATPMRLSEISALFTPPPLAPADTDRPFDPLVSKSWPALQEALQVLTGLTPAGTAANIKNSLPAPAAKLLPTTLFFLAALRMGNIESWLGANTLQALRDSGRKDIAEKLGGDFAKISTQSRETISGEWRGISLPLLHDEQIQQAHIFMRKNDDGQNENESGGKSTRFLLNLTLSRMGDIQLDGFLKSKNFDMILRTQDNLPFETRQELMQAYTKGIEQAGLQGSMSFQTRAQKWVNIDLPGHAGTLA